MAKGALFDGLGAPIPGREKSAHGVLEEAGRYCARLQQEGRIGSFKWVALEPHGRDLEGFVLVRGEKEELAQLRVDDGFVRVIVAVQAVCW
jgi:hypothetical protein